MTQAIDDFSDHELIEEINFRQLGNVWEDDVVLGCFETDEIIQHLEWIGYRVFKDASEMAVINTATSKDREGLEKALKHFLYDLTGKMMEVKVLKIP